MTNIDLSFDGSKVSVVENHTHLDLSFDKNAKWQTHIDYMYLANPY